MKNNKYTSLSAFLAKAGVASRRKATQLIKDGLVSVNGIKILEPGYKVSDADTIHIGNKPIVHAQEKIYILLNKPAGVITTTADEKARKTVLDVLHLDTQARLYPVGRLDAPTTGLLLITNDGDLAQTLAHPRYQITKKYQVTLNKPLTHVDEEKIRTGIVLDDGLIFVDSLTFVPGCARKELIVQLHSGKNRIIRRIFKYLSYTVKYLDRIEYASLKKNGLSIGQWRYLTDHEIKKLQNLVIK